MPSRDRAQHRMLARSAELPPQQLLQLSVDGVCRLAREGRCAKVEHSQIGVQQEAKLAELGAAQHKGHRVQSRPRRLPRKPPPAARALVRSVRRRAAADRIDGGHGCVRRGRMRGARRLRIGEEEGALHPKERVAHLGVHVLGRA
eukprot:scaffold89637_cov27-Tisochrysis_lutea.AAC.2